MMFCHIRITFSHAKKSLTGLQIQDTTWPPESKVFTFLNGQHPNVLVKNVLTIENIKNHSKGRDFGLFLENAHAYPSSRSDKI